MHPILGDRARLALYLLAWTPVGGLLALLLVVAHGIAWPEALGLMLPLGLALAFIGLSAFYLCAAVPLARARLPRALLTHALAAAVASALWVLACRAWAETLSAAGLLPGVEQRLAPAVPLLAALGMLFFLLAVAVHYVLIAVEASHAAETRALESRVLSREAELKALRSQLQPHFLFNSLNSISALTTRNPEGARQMCLQLADFLRQSLKKGAREAITLAEELALLDLYLSVEKVRFGARLSTELRVEDAARECLLPPLLLQPLVENAIGHGIAQLVDGGVVRVEARRSGERLLLAVENPREPGGERGGGAGVGLENVRRRVAAAFGLEGRLDVVERDDLFRVELSLPATEAPEPMA